MCVAGQAAAQEKRAAIADAARYSHRDVTSGELMSQELQDPISMLVPWSAGISSAPPQKHSPRRTRSWVRMRASTSTLAAGRQSHGAVAAGGAGREPLAAYSHQHTGRPHAQQVRCRAVSPATPPALLELKAAGTSSGIPFAPLINVSAAGAGRPITCETGHDAGLLQHRVCRTPVTPMWLPPTSTPCNRQLGA